MKIGKMSWCFVSLVCMLYIGCTLKTMDTSETGSRKSSTAKVLIASQKTKFKRTLVSEIRSSLQKNDYYIKVIDVRGLRNESIQNYDAIVILNKCMAGRPDPRVEDFIEVADQKNKIVLLTTGKLDSWKPVSPEVDAMTSASTMSESNRIARVIVNKVRSLNP